MKVVILYDRIAKEGTRPDQSDALVQAEAVGRVLSDLGHESVEMTFSFDIKGFLKEINEASPQLVFNLVESVEGYGRLIHFPASILDLLAIPYTGASADALYLTSGKILTKKIIAGAGISTPSYYSPGDLKAKSIPLKEPYIIKSVWEHASVGLEESSVLSVKSSGQLLAEMQKRRDLLGGDCFAEQFIDGREFNLSLLTSQAGPEVLPPAEMRFIDYPPGKRKVVGYRAKWDEASFESLHTQRSFDFPKSEKPLLQNLMDLARRCWHLFGLRGYARVDFRVDERNQPWVLEINANPCLSPDAGFVAAASQAGLSYRQVVERIIQDVPLGLGVKGRR
ncbi:MAG: GCN5-related N-acetyltransferase [Deltaproteobacteria bacterium]|nr:GCN5-related N-acetyltransferase [Deltaproteobacteria bacterium]